MTLVKRGFTGQVEKETGMTDDFDKKITTTKVFNGVFLTKMLTYDIIS